MKDILIGALSYIPGIIMTSRRCDDEPPEDREGFPMKFNWSQLLGTLVIVILSALASSYITSRDNSKDIQHISTAANKMEAQVATMCDRIATINEAIAIIKTRQDERLEHEIARGLRRR